LLLSTAPQVDGKLKHKGRDPKHQVNFADRVSFWDQIQSHRTATQSWCELFLEIDFSLKNRGRKFLCKHVRALKMVLRHFGANSAGTFKALHSDRQTSGKVAPASFLLGLGSNVSSSAG
jgi:hypothetical protein